MDDRGSHVASTVSTHFPPGTGDTGSIGSGGTSVMMSSTARSGRQEDGAKVLNQYIILHELGKGSAGEVP